MGSGQWCRDRRPDGPCRITHRASSIPVILSERMRVEALRSAGGAKPRNEVTKGSSKDYSQPILLLLFATEGRDPSTPLRMTGRGHSYNNSLCHKAKLHFDRNFTLLRGKTSLAKQTSPFQEILRLHSVALRMTETPSTKNRPSTEGRFCYFYY